MVALLRAWAAVESPSPGARPTPEDRRRLLAMRSAFGADGSRETTTLWVLADPVRWLDHELRSPFDGMLEGPRGIIALYQKYGEELAAKVDDLRELVEKTVREGAGRAFGVDPELTIGDEELRRAGYDPGPEPEPGLDDWSRWD